MKSRHYILDAQGNPVPELDLMKWAAWYEKSSRPPFARRVAWDKNKRVEISTVFLALDHSFRPDGPPVLWETKRNQLGQRIAPGIWIDREGSVHWSITELLQMVDLPDTPENRTRVAAMLREKVLKASPSATITLREKPD